MVKFLLWLLLFVIACLLCVGVWLLSYVVLRLVLSGRASASCTVLISGCS